MKKTLLLCVLILLCQKVILAQKQTPIIVENVDFLGNGTIDDSKPIENTRRLQLKINNVNRSLYDITVNGTTVSFNNTQPTLFSLITAPDIAGLKAQLKIVDDINLYNAHNEEESPTLESEIGRHDSDDLQHIKNYDSYMNQLSDADLFQSFNAEVNKLQAVNDFLNQLNKLLIKDGTTYTEIDRQRSEAFTSLCVKFNGEQCDNKIENMDNIIASCFKRLDDAYKKINTAFGNLKVEFAAIGVIKDKIIANLKKEKKPDEKDISDINLLYAEEVINVSLIGSKIEDAKATYTTLQDWKSKGFSSQLETAYNKINENNFSYISPSFKAGGDELDLTISIVPKNGITTYNLNSSKLNNTYNYRVYGWKVDFSTGIMATFAGNLFDETFRLDTVSSKKNKVINQNSNRNKVLPSVGAFMHAYRSTKSIFGYGGSIGVSLNANSKLNYHFGLSALLGSKNRLVVTWGILVTQVQVLAAQYNVGQEVPLSLTSVDRESVYRWGQFWALSWNISGGTKSDDKR